MKKLFTTVAMLLLPLTANAEGWYGGVAGGSASVDTGVTAVSGATLDETGTGTSLFIGKEIDKGLSVEGFYADLGEASLSGDNGDTFTLNGTAYQFNTTGSIAISSTTIGMAAKFKFDMGDTLRGYAKGGLHSWDSEAKVSTATASATATTDGTDILWGIGAEYGIGEKTALLLGYDSYTLDDDTVNLLHAGILVKF